MRLLRAVGAAATFTLLAACSDVPTAPVASPTVFPSPVIYPTRPAVVTNTPAPAATPLGYDGRWRALTPAIEYTLLQGRSNGFDELLIVARVDLRRAVLRVLYDPQAPRRARDWQLAAGADLVINGGFFDETHRATGLLIADGQAFGRSYRGFGGMFALRDGRPSLQWLRTHPYRFDPAIEQAVQSFPMLVVNAQRVEGITDNGQRNRRSFVALDRAGAVLLGVTQMAQWTLTDLADFLVASPELRVVHALNLDGGGSSGLWLAGDLGGISMDSFEPVPAVIAIFSR
ncbi:MAG: hypothetical protein KatS3mg053_4031 [Candidatus Roseilinea sp.]|nr:MAG: hypothetical protein KatS3mg053_4031 [Candidatus Roseilinea sp.]